MHTYIPRGVCSRQIDVELDGDTIKSVQFTGCLLYTSPGGMMSNLISQLEVQKAAHRLPEVMAEIPKVRAEVGYPPLVTPMSQIVGTQAVFNVLTGKRWSVISKEMKDYVCGYYGKAPGNMDKDVYKRQAHDRFLPSLS